MKVTVIPVVTGGLGTILKKLEKVLDEKGIKGRIEIIQTTAMLRSDRIVTRVLKV